MDGQLAKQEALQHLGKGQLFLLKVLDQSVYVFALKGTDPATLRRQMRSHDLGDLPSPSDPYYEALRTATVTVITDLSQVQAEHRDWLPHLCAPFEEYINWIDPTVAECIDISAQA